MEVKHFVLEVKTSKLAGRLFCTCNRYKGITRFFVSSIGLLK